MAKLKIKTDYCPLYTRIFLITQLYYLQRCYNWLKKRQTRFLSLSTVIRKNITTYVLPPKQGV